MVKQFRVHIRADKDGKTTGLRNKKTKSKDKEHFIGKAVDANEKVEVLSEDGQWASVKASKGTGYILKTHLTPPCPWGFESYGTKKEPCFVFRNVFKEAEGKHGTAVKDIMKASFKKKGKALPHPTGSQRWASWKNGGKIHGKGLVPKAKQLLEYLRKLNKGHWHVNTPPACGFQCKDVNITGPKGGHPPHQDAQKYGRLLLLFTTGNTSVNTIRLGGKKGKEKEIQFKSGDCLVFEGQTWHSVKKIHAGTSPFKHKKHWMLNRRMSVLVRQHLPKKPPQRPYFLLKKKKK